MLNHKIKILFFVVMFGMAGFLLRAQPQNKILDSLKIALKNSKQDTLKIKLRILIGENQKIEKRQYWDSIIQDCKTAFSKQTLSSALKTSYNFHLFSSYGNLGLFLRKRGDFAGALEHYTLQLNLGKEASDKKLTRAALNNIGAAYGHMKKVDLAIEYYLKGLNIADETGDKKDIAASLFKLAEAYSYIGKSDTALKYFNRCLKINEHTRDSVEIITVLNKVGRVYRDRGDIEKALKYYGRALIICELIGDENWTPSTLNNLAVVYENKGDILKALEYYYKSLKINEGTGDKESVGTNLNNIGALYLNQQETIKAIECFQKALKINEEIDDGEGLSYSYYNLGIAYDRNGDPFCKVSKEECKKAAREKALDCYEKSLNLREARGDKKGSAFCMSQIGVLYLQGDPRCATPGKKCIEEGFQKAVLYLQRSLDIHKEIGNKKGISATLKSLARLKLSTGKTGEAENLAKQSLQMAKELGFPDNERACAELLKTIYHKQHKYKESLEMYELEIKMRDSISNEFTKKASVKSQLKYEYEKQAAADSVAHAKESEIKNVELQKQSAEIKAKKNEQYALFGGLGLVLIFAGFMFNRFKVTQKQKGIIESQKSEVENQKKIVEEKQKEVVESIRYAKRIQMAQIPSEKMGIKTLDRIRKK